MKKQLLYIIVLNLFCLGAFSQKNQSFVIKQGDKYFGVFNYTDAISKYKKGLLRKNVDSLYVIQKIADSYRLINNAKESEGWYKFLISRATDKKNLVYYADALRQNMNYDEALVNYQKYSQTNSGDLNIKSAIEGIKQLDKLSKDNGYYEIRVLGINSKYSDFGPAFYSDDTIFYSSNRIGKNTFLRDNWSSNNYYQIYRSSADVASSKSKDALFKKNSKYHDGPVAYDRVNRELIFTRTLFSDKLKTASDKKTVNLNLYSVKYPLEKGKEKLNLLPFNSKEFSTAHPSISRDGSTLYFASNRPGGYGGTDIYKAMRNGAAWSEPVNLGPEINSTYDEKFPFISDDGTLFYSSNALGGLGGLDIYYSKPLSAGSWAKTINAGIPLNSNKDDFGLVSNQSKRMGYFTSNRDGGVGDDDIYGFAWTEIPQLTDITVRVIDAATNKIIANALVTPSGVAGSKKLYSNEAGVASFAADLSKNSCIVEAFYPGYQKNNASVNTESAKVIIDIPLYKESTRIKIYVKEQNTNYPIRDVNVLIKDMNTNKIITMRTNSDGFVEGPIENINGVKIGSNDFYNYIQGSIGKEDQANAEGFYIREYFIPYQDRKVNVPLSSDCFDNLAQIKVIDNNSKEEVFAAVDQNKTLNVALRPFSSYTIVFGDRSEVLNTKNLYPGEAIQLECKYVVGQTWILKDIYYDLDKSFIRPDAALELNKLVTILKQNPTLEIELGSHTDCRSSAAYNQALSARRASAALSYVVSKGISVARIKAKGYGESKLLNNCYCEPDNNSPCSDEEHQLNRRTEVRVTKY